jgi:predicted ArsR family transcriptional regulator
LEGLEVPPMPSNESQACAVEQLQLPLDHGSFVLTFIRELTGCLEDIVGLQDASGFVRVVGQQMGEQINQQYKAALGVDGLTRDQVRSVLVDLKRRIQGDFFVIEEDDRRLVLGNRRCPFGEAVKGRPSMCMMTSNVFGYIASQNLGYAKVVLEQTIARGDPGCRVVVYFKASSETDAIEGQVYLRG